MVLAGKLNTEIVGMLVAGDVPAVGLSGVDGGMIVARRQAEPDLGFVGEVEHVNVEVLAHADRRGLRPGRRLDRGGRARASRTT